MPATPTPPTLTTTHWLLLGLLSAGKIGTPERLAAELDLDIDQIETLCGDLEMLGWLERVQLH